MKITCQSCGATVPAANLDLARSLAKCTACNHVFNCRTQLDGMAAAPRRPEVPMPKGIEVFRRVDGLRIVRRWFGPKIIGLLVFCCFWDGFMVLWYAIAIRKGIWPMAAFGVLHLAVGIGLTYYVVAGFVNRTTLTRYHGAVHA